MAKNGQNALIFGKLVIFNDSKRPIEDFLKILIFGHFFAYLGSNGDLLESLEITSLPKIRSFLPFLAVF